jgi:hypothetical protein
MRGWIWTVIFFGLVPGPAQAELGYHNSVGLLFTVVAGGSLVALLSLLAVVLRWGTDNAAPMDSWLRVAQLVRWGTWPSVALVCGLSWWLTGGSASTRMLALVLVAVAALVALLARSSAARLLRAETAPGSGHVHQDRLRVGEVVEHGAQ